MSDATANQARLQEATHYPHGAFSWVDLAATDPAGAKQFYAALFGWTFEDAPAGEGQPYTMFFLQGKPVAGMIAVGPEQQKAGVTSHWVSYITVDDLDATTGKVAWLKGAVISPPFDVPGSGRMSVVRDPTGAGVSLWQPREHAGSAYASGIGVPGWHELFTGDVAAAAEFYRELLGWACAFVDYQGERMAACNNGEQPVAMIVPLRADAGDDKPYWSVYVGVDDVPACIGHAQEMGGALLHGPRSDVGYTSALLRDPQGALFYVVGAPA